MNNTFHDLFSDFIDVLDLSNADKQNLVSIRDELKEAIIHGFKKAPKVQNEEVPVPKFSTQGSFVYRTINNPAYPPQQQIDLDYGVYLPFTALEDGKRPKTNAKLFFTTIETILAEHIAAKGHGWKVERGKNACVRVEIDNRIHIDLPLYGVPDNQIHRVVEARNMTKAIAMDSVTASMESLFEAAEWENDIDPVVIHLADREKGWVPSDPIILRHWVKAEFDRKPHAREVCRYLKAWRDEYWKDGSGPSSIFLLAHAICTYDHTSSKHCEILANAIDRLPEALNKPLLVPCPKPENPHAKEDLCDRLSPEQKANFHVAFCDLRQKFKESLREENPVSANLMLVRIFGKRFPNNPRKITKKSAIATTPHVVVRNTPADHKPLRSKNVSTSG